MEDVAISVMQLVAPRFRAEFLQFIEAGEASAEFLAYLDRDEDCQDAIELALAEQTDVIREAIDLIRHEISTRELR